MTSLALAVLLAQSPAATGERSIVSKCAVSDDATYGYTKENPIRVGGTPVYGASRQRRYLSALAGPGGQPVTFQRRGALAPNAEGIIIDHYQASYQGAEKPIDLYLDFYRWDPPKAPMGLLCGADIGLAPPQDPDAVLTQMIDLALEAGQTGEVPAIPLGADGSTRHGVAIDTFRFMAGSARMLLGAGGTAPLVRQEIRGLRPGQVLVVAYALECGGQVRRPTRIDLSDSAKKPAVVRGAYLPDTELRRMLMFATIPDGALGVTFGGPTLPPGGEVRVTYDGPACPGDSPVVSLPVKAGPPIKIVDVRPAWPMGVMGTPAGGPVTVQIRATIDLAGVPTNLQVVSPPSEFNLAAATAVRQWRYKPWTINGAPAYVPVTMTVTVTFTPSRR